jgi:hypothetical protein
VWIGLVLIGSSCTLIVMAAYVGQRSTIDPQQRIPASTVVAMIACVWIVVAAIWLTVGVVSRRTARTGVRLLQAPQDDDQHEGGEQRNQQRARAAGTIREEQEHD